MPLSSKTPKNSSAGAAPGKRFLFLSVLFMFGIGFPEMLVILAVALLVVGPDKLPGLARSLARTVLELKKTAESMKNEFMAENPLSDLKTLKNDLLEFKPDLQEAAKRFQDEILDIEDKGIKAAPENTAAEDTVQEDATVKEDAATGDLAAWMPANEAADAAAAGGAEIPPMEKKPEEPNLQP